MSNNDDLLLLPLKDDALPLLKKRLEDEATVKSKSTLIPLINSLDIPTDLKIQVDKLISITSNTPHSQNKILEDIVQKLIPWRKGPYNLFGETIESSWDCHMKYQYIAPQIPNLDGKTLLDVGCNNGYYLFRLHQDRPNVGKLIGFDPVLEVYEQFHLLNHFIQAPINYHLFGWQELEYFKESFDVILFMGILYHHYSPLDLLRLLGKTLKKDGELIIETQTIDEPGSYALFPQKKYMGASGMWFIPTKDCLINWIKRTGFNKVDIFEHHRLSPLEQRSTTYGPYTALEDFFDKNEDKTIEGYPPPYRTYLRIKR